MGVLQLGKNYRLKVEDPANLGQFLTIGGEGRLSFSSSPDTIDGASKDDGNYKVEYFGQQKIALTVSGVTKLPDDGLKALFDAAKSSSPIKVKLVETVAPTDMFVCDVTVGGVQADFDKAQSATYSFNLSLAAAPTTNALFG